MLPPPPRSTLFPYTTLFRSNAAHQASLPRRSRRQPASLCRVEGSARQARARRDFAGSAQDDRGPRNRGRSEEHTSELQSRRDLVCRLLLEKKKKKQKNNKKD